MSLNLLELLSNPAGQALIKQASGFLGESEDATSNALTQAIPGLLGGLLKKSSNENGTKGIMDLITQNKFDGGMLDDVAGAFGGDGANNLLNMGGTITNMLFSGGGNQMSGIIDLITKKSGIGAGSAGNLLKLAAPFILSRIGKQVKSQGLDVKGLGKLLMGQRSFVKDSAPEMFGALGLASTGNWLDKLDDAADATGDAAKKAVDKVENVVEDTAEAVGDAAKATGRAAEKAVEAGASGVNKILPWVGLAILAVLALFLLRTCGKKAVDVTGDAIEATVDKTTEVVAGAGDAIASVFNSISLPGGKEIKVAAGSFMEDFVGVLNGAEWDIKKPFIAKDIKFESGSATLTAESMDVVNNLASAMEAFPSVEVKLEGHTDVTGDAETNMQISQQRALAVKKALTDHGIAATRIDAVGMGESHPLETNTTEAGKAENRRVEIYITKK